MQNESVCIEYVWVEIWVDDLVRVVNKQSEREDPATLVAIDKL